MANESVHISIAADNEENTMKVLPVGRGHHCCKSQGLDELLAKFYADLVALGPWKPISGYVRFLSFQLSKMKESMRKMEVSMFKVNNHIIYSYSNITDCGRQETFSSGARLFESSARSAVVIVSGTPPNMYPRILPALDLNSIISVSSAGF